ncbi:MAG: hypothetical protein LBK12_06830 [Odoribacteraceae bacterium]|jgi:hypothetical protein|nr:hypothetical protein [Odoribacteraceae bacterium]
MPKKSFLNQPDEVFLTRARSVHGQCASHANAWGIDPSRMFAFSKLLTAAERAHAANSVLATRNHVTSTNKKIAFGELKHFLGQLIDWLEGTPSVSDADIDIMGLRPRVRKAREPLPPPVEAPLLIVTRRHDEMTIHVTRLEHGHPTGGVTSRKPYHGFKLRWRFEGETRYNVEVSTRLRITLHFEREDEGKRVELVAAWMNPRLQEGPWSDVITVIAG